MTSRIGDTQPLLVARAPRHNTSHTEAKMIRWWDTDPNKDETYCLRELAGPNCDVGIPGLVAPANMLHFFIQVTVVVGRGSGRCERS
jgi:hypothetical protein